jgi:peptidoglycan/xylan/chitin deacetylase (PgdA/CDA1 family)
VSERVTRNWSYDQRNCATEPFVSFCFDDFPRSAAKAGSEILGEFGIKGTYFASGGRAGRRVEGLEHFTDEDLADLARQGHEIGCHTFNHVSLPTATAYEIEEELLRNREYVRRVLGNYTMTSFAYPFGHANIAVKVLLRRFFPVCRGIWSRVNKGRIDFTQLKAVELKQPFMPRLIDEILDETEVSNGWTIFFTHDVSDHPNHYRCAPKELARVVREVIDRKIQVLPIRYAAGKVSEQPLTTPAQFP